MITRDLISGTILRRRLELGLTQAVAAKKIGMSQSALSKIEAGSLGISLEDWEKICVLYGYNLAMPPMCSGKQFRKEINTARKQKDRSVTWISDLCKRHNQS